MSTGFDHQSNGGDGAPRYPVYFVDRSGLVFRCSSTESVERHLEPMDVVTNEYTGWDSDGRELRLALVEQQQVTVSVAASAKKDVSQALASIRAALVRNGFPCEAATWRSDFVSMLKLASAGRYYEQWEAEEM